MKNIFKLLKPEPNQLYTPSKCHALKPEPFFYKYI